MEAWLATLPRCGSADFNHDGDSTTDFNGDGDTATDADVEAFFRVGVAERSQSRFWCGAWLPVSAGPARKYMEEALDVGVSSHITVAVEVGGAVAGRGRE